MALTLNGSANTIAGVAVGGLPDGIVDTDMLAASAVTGAKSSGLGITHADTWIMTTNFTSSALPITSNWEQINEAHLPDGVLGASMSQSSGVFTFPVTGHWFLRFQASFRSTVEQDHTGAIIDMTLNNGTDNYPDASSNYSHITRTGGSGSVYSNVAVSFIVDITDVSNHKVRFGVEVEDSNTTTRGDSEKLLTGANFIRLGDT